MRGAWIEINGQIGQKTEEMSLPVRGAWIEINVSAYASNSGTSLPVRGAWIEIIAKKVCEKWYGVAPCEGSVD